MRTRFLSNILLMFMWVAFTGVLSFINFVFGFIASFIILRIITLNKEDSKYFRIVPKIIAFVLFFLYELIIANIDAAYYIMIPNKKLRPGIVGVPLDAKTDLEITFLTNLVSLTPGTLSIDVSNDRKILYVHSMNISDREKFVNKIKCGFEKRLLEILR